MSITMFSEEKKEGIPPFPEEYKILPEIIDWEVPGFLYNANPYTKTLALKNRDCGEWYNEFHDRIVEACGREFLPVCRMSDGEFIFITGTKPPDVRLSYVKKIRHKLVGIRDYFKYQGGFTAFTVGHYHSGLYSEKERKEAQTKYAEQSREIAEKGILALHLNYNLLFPFHESHFPGVRKWLDKNSIRLTDKNYYPFYFVYAALAGSRRGEILKGRRALVVNGEHGEKKEKIIAGLYREGVKEVHWIGISKKRSLFDKIDVCPYVGKVDIAFVGAGIGKPNILVQMESLQVPCIDVGFVFEVWADPESRWERPLLASDEDYEKQNGNHLRE